MLIRVSALGAVTGALMILNKKYRLGRIFPRQALYCDYLNAPRPLEPLP